MKQSTGVIATFNPAKGSKVPEKTAGKIDAKVTTSMALPITDITKVKSGSFTSSITIDKWQA